MTPSDLQWMNYLHHLDQPGDQSDPWARAILVRIFDRHLANVRQLGADLLVSEPPAGTIEHEAHQRAIQGFRELYHTLRAERAIATGGNRD